MRLLLGTVGVCIVLCSPCWTEEAQEPVKAETIQAARDLVQMMADGKFEDVVARFDAQMVEGLPVGVLRTVWQSLIDQAGAFQHIDQTYAEKHEGVEVVVLECRFEKSMLLTELDFDATGKVCGLRFQPAGEYRSPDYVKPVNFATHRVVVRCGGYSLPGELTVPAANGPFPAIVLVHGSGPHDRHESIGPNKPFLDLAQGLASTGIAVLCYDKRTMVYPEEFAADRGFTVKEEVVDDAVAAVGLLRANAAIDPEGIYVLGHSLGGMVAPRVAASEPNIAGLILMAASNEPLEDACLRQTEYLVGRDGTVGPEEQQHLELTKQQVARAKDPALSAETPATELPLGTPASYWLDLRTYDPLATVAGLGKRVLVLQGERDYQVTMEEFGRWREALEPSGLATFKQYPKLNHLMMAGDGPASPDEYFWGGNVAEEVVSDIAQWVKERR